jgi:transcription initiation factor TFIIB
MDSSSPNDFVMRFSSKLGLSNDIKELCKYIVTKADEVGIVSENTPPSISAAAIYLCNMMCNLGMSKADISKQCDISQVTLCKCYKKLFGYRGMLFPSEAIHKYNIK